MPMHQKCWIFPEKGDPQWENTVWLREESSKLSHTSKAWKLAEDGTKINEDEKNQYENQICFTCWLDQI